MTVAEPDEYGGSRWHDVSVRPGMTGPWQVGGRNDISCEERVALDRCHVENRSTARDRAILLRTVGVVLRREGAR